MSGALISSQADVIPFTLYMDGGVDSPATGKGLFIEYNTTSQILSLVAGYGSGTSGIDLIGDFTAAHIHNADTSIFKPLSNTQFPVGSTKSGVLLGTVDYSGFPSELTELLNGMQYVNVHSTFKPGGEIYGNLIPTIVPEPGTIALLGLGASGLLAFRRRK